MTNHTTPLILKYRDWPAADRQAWDALFAEGDIIDGAGPCTHWSQGSRRKRLQSYGHWLGYLARTGRLATTGHPGDRATPPVVRAFLDDERHRCSLRTAYIHAEDLWFVLRAMAPARDWDWLYKMVLRLRASCNLGELKPCPGVSASHVFAWAHKRMREVEAQGGPIDLDRAVDFRDGLSVGLLMAVPLRVRTFTAIEIGRQLVDHGDGYLLRLAPEDVKDRRHHEYPVPNVLTGPMRRYLEAYRPILLQGRETQRLWVSRRGAPLGIDSFTGHLADLTRREFGETLRPHAFRHIAATSIALEDPDHVGVTADVLGHATIEMSQKYYNHATGIRAMAHHQQLVQALKKEARQWERERHRRDRLRRLASAGRVRARDHGPSEDG